MIGWLWRRNMIHPVVLVPIESVKIAARGSAPRVRYRQWCVHKDSLQRLRDSLRICATRYQKPQHHYYQRARPLGSLERYVPGMLQLYICLTAGKSTVIVNHWKEVINSSTIWAKDHQETGQKMHLWQRRFHACKIHTMDSSCRGCCRCVSNLRAD